MADTVCRLIANNNKESTSCNDETNGRKGGATTRRTQEGRFGIFGKGANQQGVWAQAWPRTAPVPPGARATAHTPAYKLLHTRPSLLLAVACMFFFPH